MTTDETTWAGSEVERAPTWLRRLSCFHDDDAPPTLFRGIVERFRALEHLDAPLDRDAPATPQLEALAAKQPGLRSLSITSVSSGASTAALASLPLEEVRLSARLLRDAAGSWSAGLAGVREVSIMSREPLRVPDPAAWAGLRACESLELQRIELDAATVRAIASLPALRRLSLRHCVLAAGALAALGASPSLERLTVTGATIGAADAEGLATASRLKVAVLAVGEAADARALRPLAERGVALGISLIGRIRLDDAMVAALCAALPELRGLSLGQHQLVGLTKKLTADGLAPIGGLADLRWLSLDGLYVRGIKPAHLSFVGGLPALRSLSLRNAGKLSAAVVDAFVGATALRALDLRGIALSDAAAKKLAALPLETLALSDAKVGAKGLAALAATPALRELSIDHATGYSDAHLKALGGATTLEWLALGTSVSAKVYPSDLRSLAALPRLRALTIAEVGVHDGWIESLAGAPALASLRLGRSDCSFSGGTITDAAVDAGLAIAPLETIGHWSFRPSAAAQAAIEAAGRGAWVPGDYGRWLSIEGPEDAPLVD